MPPTCLKVFLTVGVLIASDSVGLFAADERQAAQEQPKASAQDKSVNPEAIGQAFKDAIHHVEGEKTQQRKVVASDLEAQLSIAIRDWLSLQHEKKASELQKLIDQRWETLQESFGDPRHYNYYLRGFAYVISRKDVLETTSLIAPYKATLQFVEKLYVTRYYPPHISYPEQFRYTVTTPIEVEFEYQGEQFLVTRTDRGQTSIAKGW